MIKKKDLILSSRLILILIILLLSCLILILPFSYSYEPDLFALIDTNFNITFIQFNNKEHSMDIFNNYIKQNDRIMNGEKTYNLVITRDNESLSRDLIFLDRTYVLMTKDIIDSCNETKYKNLIFNFYFNNTLITKKRVNCYHIINTYELNKNILSKKTTCKDFNSEPCKTTCFGQQIFSSEGFCCIGTCKDKKTSNLQNFIIILLIVILLILLFSLIKKNKLKIFSILLFLLVVLPINAYNELDLLEKGYKRFLITTYYTPHERNFDKWYSGYDYLKTDCYKNNPRLHYCCVPPPNRGFYEEVKCQGSGITNNGLLCRYNTIKKNRYESMFSCMKLSNYKYGITSTGKDPKPFRTIAVDPNQIPYGTEVEIIVPDKSTLDGCYIAEDTGSGIKDKHIDIFTGFIKYPYKGYGYLKIGCGNLGQEDKKVIDKAEDINPVEGKKEFIPLDYDSGDFYQQFIVNRLITNNFLYYDTNIISLNQLFFKNYFFAYKIINDIIQSCYPSPSENQASICIEQIIKNNKQLYNLDIVFYKQDSDYTIFINSYNSTITTLNIRIAMDSLIITKPQLIKSNDSIILRWKPLIYNNIGVDKYIIYFSTLTKERVKEIMSSRRRLAFSISNYEYDTNNMKLLVPESHIDTNNLYYDVFKNEFVVKISDPPETNSIFIIPLKDNKIIDSTYLTTDLFVIPFD